jgi:hypothetical protein
MIINKDTGTKILAKLDKAQIMKLARLSRRIREWNSVYWRKPFYYLWSASSNSAVATRTQALIWKIHYLVSVSIHKMNSSLEKHNFISEQVILNYLIHSILLQTTNNSQFGLSVAVFQLSDGLWYFIWNTLGLIYMPRFM